MARGRDLDQLVGRRGHQRPPGLGPGLMPMVGPKDAQDGDFIAGLELRAAYAVLPRLEWEGAALDYVKAYPVEKIYNIGEGEDGVEFVLFGFGNQTFDEFAAHTLCLGMFVYRQGTDFGCGRTVEMESPAAEQLFVEGDDGEIADGLRHLEFGAGEHDAAGGIVVDEMQNGCDIVHHGFADREARGCGGRFRSEEHTADSSHLGNS